jgi:hypothetical protein
VTSRLTDDPGVAVAERLLSPAANWYYRPIGAAGGIFSERPVYPGT